MPTAARVARRDGQSHGVVDDRAVDEDVGGDGLQLRQRFGVEHVADGGVGRSERATTSISSADEG